MSNHQQVTIVRDTAESNREVDALAQAQAEAPPQEAAPEVPVERPQWLPEKFKDPTELAKAYSELEKKVGSKTSDFSGLDQYSQEFAQNGDLSEESIQAIVGMGLPEPLVRAYVDGQKAVMDSNINAVMETAGGRDEYNAMIEWAGNTFPEAQIDAFNTIIEGGNMSAIQMAVAGLKAQYQQANGSRGRLIQGETSGPSGGAFRSVAEIVSAMKDPRYAKDPAYRKDVEQRVALSNALGANR